MAGVETNFIMTVQIDLDKQGDFPFLWIDCSVTANCIIVDQFKISLEGPCLNPKQFT